MVVRRLSPEQINVSLRRLQNTSEKIDEGLKIFEINSQEDYLFGSEIELLNHIVNVLGHNDLNRIAREIKCTI